MQHFESHKQELQLFSSEKYSVISKKIISDLDVANIFSAETLISNSAKYPVHK